MARLSFLSVAALVGNAAAITLSVASSGGNETSGYQYGLMFEEINYSGDGGIYAELIRNRAFQGSTVYPSTLDPWTAVGNATLALTNASSLSTALPTSVQVTSLSGGTVGIKNPGWWGIDIRAANTYKGSFYSLGAYSGDFTASIVSDITNETLASVTIPSSSVNGSWTEHTYEFTPAADASNSNNSFVLTYKATPGHALNLNLISLFPPTYNDRPNGNRPDLMETLGALNARHLRIPGGNNLEGEVAPYRYVWNATIGNLTDRPGRPGAWGYANTDGIGLIEYMLWSQDLGLEPVLAVWSGLYLGGEIIAEDALEPYVQDALNELEFLMGDASTTYGAQRIALGYEDPFVIKFVEVGNEDDLVDGGEDSYIDYRFKMFYDAISAAYPDILIFSSLSKLEWTYESCGQDFHDYSEPDAMVQQFNYFDNMAAGNPIQVGEFAIVVNNTQITNISDYVLVQNTWSYWIGAVSEAVFIIGMERNADRVWGWSYAPLLQNLNAWQWSPDLVAFTANQSQTFGSVSYDVQHLFGNHPFTSTLPVTAGASDDFQPAYWVAGVDNTTGTQYIKAAIYNSTGDVPFDVAFEGLGANAKATLTVLTAPDGYSHGVLGNEHVTTTTTTNLTAGANGTFSFSLPNLSVAVLAASAEEAC